MVDVARIGKLDTPVEVPQKRNLCPCPELNTPILDALIMRHDLPQLWVAQNDNFIPTTSRRGTEAALARAREAARGRDVRVGGGVNVIQQYLRQRLIDELHIAISPVLLGSGERLFEGVNLPALGYSCIKHVVTPRATHVVLSRQ